LDQKYFIHPLLREHSVLFRQYQNTILQKTLYKNSLIVVPTSLGKTIITLLICIDILYNWKKSKILILAPSRPLVHQHLDLFKRFTKLGNVCFALTGKISPDIRKTIWKSRSIRIYFATPELVRNDLDNNLLKKDDFYLVVFDESHRAVKDYSYTTISKKFYSNNDFSNIPMLLALSASPGSNKEKIQEICSNLYIEQIIVKSEDDEDVLPYVYNIDIKHRYVNLDDKHKEISSILQSMIDDKIKWLIDNNFIKKKKIENIYRKDLLNLSDRLKSAITNSDNKNFFLYAALKYQSMSMILLYCRDLVESQGIFSLKKFFNKFEDSGGDNDVPTRTYQELLSDPRIRKVIEMLKNDKILLSHPKLLEVLLIVKDFLCSNNGGENVSNTSAAADCTDIDYTNIKQAEEIKVSNKNSNSNLNTLISNEKKILIFSQYRDTLEEITDLLKKHNIQSRGFYGQSNKKDQRGLNQDKQLSILADFKKGLFPVLVATSVAEEGLDIPNVDLVVFYEPVPSEIRFIQRKGRTGRFSDGKVVVLVANNSIDSKYLEIAQKKIIKMKHVLKDVNFILNNYDKRSFSNPDRMDLSEIGVFNINDTNICSCSAGDNNNNDNTENFNPIIDSIASNSSKKIKYFVKKLSYKNNNIDGDNLSYSVHDLEHLYDVSLALDSRKMIEKTQRQIHDLLAKSGKNGLEISYLKEMIKFQPYVIDKAIKNLEKLKRIIWINKKTISLVDSIKFIPGKKYSIFIEKILFGKAIVIVNEKWFASLDYFDYSGPRKLLKKGNVFDIIGDIYKRDGTLHLIVKKTM
jgi:ERCC4-related helicase